MQYDDPPTQPQHARARISTASPSGLDDRGLLMLQNKNLC